MTSTAVRPLPGRLLPADALLRRLTLMSLMTTIGNGLFVTVSVLFFTRSIGLTPSRVALGLTCAGVCGVLAGVPMGRLADRVGSKRLLLVVGPLEGLAVLGYALVHSFLAFVLLACAATVLERGAVAVRSALIARVLPAETQVRSRAYLRSVMNAGVMLGAGGAALALQADSRVAYLAVLALDALSYLGATALLSGLRVPAVVLGEAMEGAAKRRSALRNRPYLLVTSLHAVLELQLAVLNIGIPLWIALSTGAPRWVISAVLVLNCLTVVLFQVRATRGVGDVRTAARACTRGALLLAGACLVYGTAQHRSAVLAGVLMIGGVLLHNFGELLTSAGGWTLSLDLADPRSHGEYQGVFMSGQAAAHVIGPLVVTSTAVAHGYAGWAVLAGLFAVAGLVLPAASRLAQRQDPGSSRHSTR